MFATLASRFPAFAGVVLPYAIASASVPIVALAPLAIVWFGIGPGSKIAIAALMTFFPTFVGTLRGLLGVDARSLELMRSLAATEWQVFWKLRLPHSLPHVFTALRACTTLAMIGAVVSEFFGGPMKSLGVYIKSTASLFQTRQAWSAILVACVLGLLFYLAVALVERLAVPWRAERSAGERDARARVRIETHASDGRDRSMTRRRVGTAWLALTVLTLAGLSCGRGRPRRRPPRCGSSSSG